MSCSTTCGFSMSGQALGMARSSMLKIHNAATFSCSRSHQVRVNRRILSSSWMQIILDCGPCTATSRGIFQADFSGSFLNNPLLLNHSTFLQLWQTPVDHGLHGLGITFRTRSTVAYEGRYASYRRMPHHLLLSKHRQMQLRYCQHSTERELFCMPLGYF